MRPVQRPLYRAASWVLVVVVLASTLAAVFGTAAATSTTYTLTGFVDQPGTVTKAPVPAGVTVDLVNRADGSVYATTTGAGGQFKFTSSGTSGALAPGYWGLYVPTAIDSSVSGCKPYRCTVASEQPAPVYAFYTANVLTHPTANPQLISNVQVLPYNATLNGTVMQGSGTVAGATVKLLAPADAGLVLASNTSNATGFYNLSVPYGTWVLQASHTSGSNFYSNSTKVSIAARLTHAYPLLKAYSISGRISSSATKAYVTVGGNATLYDPTDQYLYTIPTAPGGYYAFSSYPADFTKVGSQETFYVVLSSVGFETVWYPVNISSPTPAPRSVTTSPRTTAERGTFSTTLDFTGVNPATGKGKLNVSTSVQLGNDSEVPGLPNGSVGQLWAQLGLDYDHSMNFSAASATAFEDFVADEGPFFPATQAGTTFNGTTFVAPTAAQGMTNFTFASGCTTTCGLSSAQAISYGWTNSYKLNGTVGKSSDSYSISFKFQHPSSSQDVYNYTLELPSGYALSAGTTAPANSTLLGTGPQASWTAFTLESKASSTPSASVTFSIVKIAAVTAKMAVTSTNAFFSKANVLNSTRNYYTVVLAEGTKATFSASSTTYPTGVNGTEFVWNWGNGHSTTVPNNASVNYTYAVPNGTTTYDGKLTVYASSGANSSAKFFVWVLDPADSVPTAGIASNATGYENRTSGTAKYLFVNWTTSLKFNASATMIAAPDNLSIAAFTLTAHNFTSSANYTVSKGASARSNWTVAFGANTTSNTTGPGHGYYVHFNTLSIGGAPLTIRGWGWEYVLTLTVWSLVGTKSTTSLTILVNDTEPPIPSLAILTATGKTISGSSIVEGPKHYVNLQLDAAGSVSFGNGTVTNYTWFVSNPGNTTSTSGFKNQTYTVHSVKPYPTIRLYPKTTDYSIKLTVDDSNGVSANTTKKLEVADNTTLRPIMEANNLTGPTTLNAGTSYTYQLNVTVGGGSKAIADNITVKVYLLSASASGSRNYIAGTPGSVTFYGYSNSSKSATVNSTVLDTGLIPELHHGKTVLAVVHWDPSKSGSFTFYAQAYATNAFVNNSSVSIVSTAITVHPNPTTQLIEYGGIAAGVVVVIVALVLFYRRRTRKGGPAKPAPSSKSGLERGGKRTDDDDDE